MAKRQKKRRKKSILQKFFSYSILILSIILIVSILILNVLDFLHLILVIGIIFVIYFIVFITIRKKKWLGYFLSIVFSVIFLFLTINVNKTVSFLNGLNLDYKTYHYSVVVLKTSEYKKLKDINNKKLGYYDDGSNENEKALNKVRGKQELDVVPYEDTHKLAESLLQGDIDAVLIEDSYLDILNESIEKDGEVFKSLIREIYDFVIIVKTSDISKDLNVTETPFNIYITGIDTYGEISSVSRSDVNMIVTVNPKTRQILLTSVPRDYYVKLHGKSGYNDKLTHAGLYGIDMSVHTLEDLLDIEINYYVKVNFTSVVKIVDAVGGVSVNSDYDFTSIDNFHYNKGINDLNGEEALSFARERKAFASGDRQRIKDQQALLSAIFEKVTSKAVISKYSKLLDSVNGSFVTNMKMSRLTSLIRLQMAKNYSWNIVSNCLNGSDSSNYTYSSPSFKSYVMEPIPESVDYAHQLIEKVLNGETLENEAVTNESSKITSSSRSKKSSTNDTDTIKKSDNTQNNKNQTIEPVGGLEVTLGKDKVEFVEGDTYVYYGYTAKYQGEDVTKNSDIKESFSINGKNYDNYQDLVLYVSGLDAGEYTITYVVQYKGETETLKQNVTISELKTPYQESDDDTDNNTEENLDDNSGENLDNKLDENE